jgi:uncharacterized protein YndB with AHSA1/START domain
MKNNWSEFRLRVNINAPVDRVYAAWATTDGLHSWFLRKAIFKAANGNPRKGDEPVAGGDEYEWYWHGYPDSVVEKGKIISANGNDKFVFSFSMGCPVSISITTQNNETIVELVESDLPTDEETIRKHYVGDMKGWTFYLANLKSVLEGGLDLRNKKEEITGVITA